ncbi:MAG: flagellin [Pseudomonadota bacterium]
MANVVNTNMMSINAQRNLYKTDSMMQNAMERLSSGLRVNSAKDDAAGLSIATRMDSQVRGMNVAIRNANDGISLAQTAEGAIGNVTDMLQRMRELGVQAMNATNSAENRVDLNKEFSSLQKEVDRILQTTQFNGMKILDGSATNMKFHVDANVGANTGISVAIKDLNGTNLSAGGIKSTLNAASVRLASGSAGTAAMASAAITSIDKAIKNLNGIRADLGAAQNRFSSTISNLQSSVENQSAAKSRIMDADFATETANLSRAQILQQSGVAMLSQANQAPQGVLGLLR